MISIVSTWPDTWVRDHGLAVRRTRRRPAGVRRGAANARGSVVAGDRRPGGRVVVRHAGRSRTHPERCGRRVRQPARAVAELGLVAALLSGLDSPIVAFEHGLFERDVAARTWRSLDIELPPAASIRGLLREAHPAISGSPPTRAGAPARRHSRSTPPRSGSATTPSARCARIAITTSGSAPGQQAWCKLSGDALVSFTTRDGMPERVVTHLAESRSGSIVACTFHGRAEVSATTACAWCFRSLLEPPFARLEMSLAQDRRGDWWLGTSRGVYRFQGPELQLERGELMGPEQGIARAAVYGRIYEILTA
ncbi:MAG: hypothetical protein U1E76_06715 [Planctomycetota bacterium]